MSPSQSDMSESSVRSIRGILSSEMVRSIRGISLVVVKLSGSSSANFLAADGPTSSLRSSTSFRRRALLVAVLAPSVVFNGVETFDGPGSGRQTRKG